MKTLLGLLILLPCLLLPAFPQNPGDHNLAGYTHGRTYFSWESKLTTPLRQVNTTSPTGLESPDLLLNFEDSFLVRDPTSEGTRYRLVEKTGQQRWERAGTLISPAHSHGIVLLGGPTTSSYAAVTVVSGSVLWETGSLGLDLGDVTGCAPIITGELAFVYGAKKVAAVRVSDGHLIWEYAPAGAGTSLDRAALSLFGDRLYAADVDGVIRCLDLLTGDELWTARTEDPPIASIIATEGTVFLAGKSRVKALSAKTGEVIWVGGSLRGRGFLRLALGSGILCLFEDESAECGGAIEVWTFDPTSGAPLWAKPFFWGFPLCYEDATQLIPMLGDVLISNGLIFVGLPPRALYGPGDGIAVLDASDGELRWFISETSKTFSTAYGSLFALLPDSIEEFRPSHETFLAEVASGQSYSSTITLTNPSRPAAAATVYFIGQDGEPLQLPVQNVGTVSEMNLTLPFQQSRIIRVLEKEGTAAIGWVRVVSDAPLTGTSTYQLSVDGEVLREVGVGDSRPSASYTFYVEKRDGFDTAVAIANPSDSRAIVHTALRNSLGASAGAFAIPLWPREHIAQFFGELVYLIPAGDFEGTLRIFADRPLVVTVIRTKDGVPISSYPAAGR